MEQHHQEVVQARDLPARAAPAPPPGAGSRRHRRPPHTSGPWGHRPNLRSPPDPKRSVRRFPPPSCSLRPAAAPSGGGGPRRPGWCETRRHTLACGLHGRHLAHQVSHQCEQLVTRGSGVPVQRCPRVSRGHGAAPSWACPPAGEPAAATRPRPGRRSASPWTASAYVCVSQ